MAWLGALGAAGGGTAAGAGAGAGAATAGAATGAGTALTAAAAPAAMSAVPASATASLLSPTLAGASNAAAPALAMTPASGTTALLNPSLAGTAAPASTPWYTQMFNSGKNLASDYGQKQGNSQAGGKKQPDLVADQPIPGSVRPRPAYDASQSNAQIASILESIFGAAQ